MGVSVKRTFFVIVVLLATFMAPVQSATAASIETLKPCAITNQSPCIESITLSNPGEEPIAAKLTGDVKVLTNEFAGQPVLMHDYEWAAEGVIHGNGHGGFYVQAFHFPDNLDYCWSASQCSKQNEEFVVQVVATWWKSPPVQLRFKGEPSDLMCGTATNPTVCNVSPSLNGDYTYEVKMRIDPSFQFGWAVGEAANGMVTVEPKNNTESLMTVRAMPVPKSTVFTTGLHNKTWRTQEFADQDLYSLSFYAMAKSHTMAKQFKGCDYGLGMSIWHNSDQILALPSFNQVDKTLEMEVGAPHLKADGTTNQAIFSFQMPLQLIQCLWGVNLAKAFKVAVSVTDDGAGGSQVGTVTATSDSKNYYFRVAGLHYSSPKIAVSFKETPPAKTTITCVSSKNKKLTKKVTSVAPKCPSGYKKK